VKKEFISSSIIFSMENDSSQNGQVLKFLILLLYSFQIRAAAVSVHTHVKA